MTIAADLRLKVLKVKARVLNLNFTGSAERMEIETKNLRAADHSGFFNTRILVLRAKYSFSKLMFPNQQSFGNLEILTLAGGQLH